MREQRTLTLTRVLQANVEESGCPTGVLCEAARELQWCMTPLLALNRDEIVEASLLQSLEGECGTSPMSEEEAALLGDVESDIQSDVKPDIEVPQVPELLEISEQAQSAEHLSLLPLLLHLLLLPFSPKKPRAEQLEQMP